MEITLLDSAKITSSGNPYKRPTGLCRVKKKNKTAWDLGIFMLDLGEGNGTPLQYSCLENPMDEGAW